jgi:hypothetical protein
MIFAAGKYQIIPLVLSKAATKLNIAGNLFDQNTQEQLGNWLLLTKRSNLGKYLKGNNSGTLAELEAAVQDVGQEFASLPIIYTSLARKVGDVSTGNGNKAYYGGVGPNPSSVTTNVGTVVQAIIKSRIQYSMKSPSYIPPYYIP